MASFKSELIVSPLDETRHFILEEDLVYYSTHLKATITVPKGFITDGASIPIGARWLFPFGGKKMQAAVVHDYLYRTGEYSKAEADYVFKEAMKVMGVTSWRVTVMYNAVRYFGGNSWRARVHQRSASITT